MLERFRTAYLSLNEVQRKIIYGLFFGATGPVAWGLAKYLHLSEGEVTVVLGWISALTPVLSTLWVASKATSQNQIKSLAAESPKVQTQALSVIADEAKVAAVNNIPGVEVKVDTTVATPEVTAVAYSKEMGSVNPKED